MNRDEWLQLRKTAIGSSDAPAVLGLNPWKTALHVFLDKTTDIQQPDNERMRWGRLLEDVVATRYAEETGAEVIAPEKMIEFHPKHRFLSASIDRYVRLDGKLKILECKTTRQIGDAWGPPHTDQVPPYYLAQVMHQLLVTGMDEADLAVLIGGQDFQIYTIQKNPEMIERMLAIYCDFWEKVDTKDPPSPDWDHPETPEIIKLIYREVVPGATVPIADDGLEEFSQYQESKKLAAKAQAQVEYWRSRLLVRLGNAEVGELPQGQGIIKKCVVNRPGFNVKPSTYTVLHHQRKR